MYSIPGKPRTVHTDHINGRTGGITFSKPARAHRRPAWLQNNNKPIILEPLEH